jgi:hypothetical protein
MEKRLTWRNNGTWGVITLGLAMIGYWLVTWLFAVSRARAGEIGIDAMAASTTLAIKGLVVGVLIVLVGVVARLLVMRKPAAG